MVLFPTLPLQHGFDGMAYKWAIASLPLPANTLAMICSVLAFGLLFVQALMINGFINHLRLFPKPNYLPGMAYLTLSSLFLQWQQLSAAMLFATLLIWLWYQLCNLHNTSNPKKTVFNLGFTLGLGALLYMPAYLFILLLLAGMLLFRPFKLSDWLIMIVGMVTPSYIFYSVRYLDTGNYSFLHFSKIIDKMPHFAAFSWLWTGVVMAVLLFVVGLFFLQKNRLRQVVHARKCWTLIYWFLTIAGLLTFMGGDVMSNWILLTAPLASIIAAAYFYMPGRWLAPLLQWLLLAIIVAVNYRIL